MDIAGCKFISWIVCFFSVSLFLVLSALVLVKSYLAASSIMSVNCFLLKEIRAKAQLLKI